MREAIGEFWPVPRGRRGAQVQILQNHVKKFAEATEKTG